MTGIPGVRVFAVREIDARDQIWSAAEQERLGGFSPFRIWLLWMPAKRTKIWECLPHSSTAHPSTTYSLYIEYRRYRISCS